MLANHATFNIHSQVPSVDDGLRDPDAEVEPDEVQRRDDEDVADQDLGTHGEHAVAQRVQKPVEEANNGWRNLELSRSSLAYRSPVTQPGF